MTEQRWLLVFDNIGADWKSIARYWPCTSMRQSAIIATSQKVTPWIPPSHRIPVEFLDDESGAELLFGQMRISSTDVDDTQRRLARKISNELGGSPFCLSLAHGTISTLKLPLKEYLELIQTRSDFLGDTTTEEWKYPKGMYATHDSLLKNLPQGAVDLLYMLSFMNPDHVGEDVLQRQHKADCLDFLRDRPTYVCHGGPLCYLGLKLT